MPKRKRDKFHRDIEHTYAHRTTVNCALNQCIPCLYKLFPNGDNLPMNCRPELCPRSSSEVFASCIYNDKKRLLTVGDGDFSFSLSLARYHLNNKKRKNAIICTSHESETSVLRTYTQSTGILSDLRLLGGKVHHEVDGAELASTTVLTTYHNKIDAVIWNFPCVSDPDGADGQVSELEQNQLLLRRFFANCLPLLRCHGEVHVTHKTCEPFSWWNIVDLAQESGLRYCGCVVFDRCLYPGYINRKALDSKSFSAFDAVTYVFVSNAEDDTYNPLHSNEELVLLCNSEVTESLSVVAAKLKDKEQKAKPAKKLS